MVWLLDGKKNFDDMFSRFDKIPACDRRTDGWTERRTDILPRHSCAMHTRRAVKTFSHSRALIEAGSNQDPVCDFRLMINSNALVLLLYTLQVSIC